MNNLFIILGLIAGVIAIVLFYLAISYINLWLQALVSNARVGLFSIISMNLRKVPPKLIVESKIMAVKAGIDVSIDDLESHFIAGGNVLRLIQALVAADKANIRLQFKHAAAVDLSGGDIFEAVQTSVNPKVLVTPGVNATAKDGVQLEVTAHVTVRANIDRLLGGAGKETILARVCEGIVISIGSAIKHDLLIENPGLISKSVLKKGLDAGTAYEILSIDIVNIVSHIRTTIQPEVCTI